MKPHQLLHQLLTLGVTLTNQNGSLIVDAAKGVVTSDLRAEIKSQKTALISLLKMYDASELCILVASRWADFEYIHQVKEVFGPGTVLLSQEPGESDDVEQNVA